MKKASPELVHHRCGVCGGRMRAGREKNTKYECGLNGITLMGVTVWKCPACEEREIEIQNILGLHQAIARNLAMRPTRLGSRQIRFLRKYLGLFSGDLATKLSEDPERLLRSMTLREKPSMPGGKGWHVVASSRRGLRIKQGPADGQ